MSLSCLIFANPAATDTNKQIADTKAQIIELQAKLKELESSTTAQKQKEEELALIKKRKDEELKTHTEFGFVSTKGNTDTTAYNLDTKIQKAFNKHQLTFIGDGEYASDNGVETKNKYFLEFNYGYKLNKRLYLEYIVGYKYDEFSGYDHRAYTGPGLKYKAVESDIHNLDLSSALLMSTDKKESDADAYNYTSWRAKVEYNWQVFKNLKFTEIFTYRTDITETDDYFIFSKTALSSKVSDIFSVGLNYKIDYVNMAEIGKQRTDKTLTANLIADF
ncbi:MAG: DUF481 domain-containing protein [Sulfurimonas sp.]|nr:DUF481 domain-containing protein [Sulfurimonas sp.]